MPRKPTPAERLRELKFVEAYTKSKSGADAYKKVFPVNTSSAARSGATRMLKKPRVQAALAPLMKSEDITVERIEQEAARMAFGAPEDTFRYDHKLNAMRLLAKYKKMLGDNTGNVTNNTLNMITLADGQAAPTVQVEQPSQEALPIIDIEPTQNQQNGQ